MGAGGRASGETPVDAAGLVCGVHAVRALLASAPERVRMLWLDPQQRDTRVRVLRDTAAAARVPVRELPRAALDRMVAGARHQGVVARCQPLPLRGERELETFLAALTEPPLLLILDGVQDPHNLGACLRSADGAGVHAVIVPRDRACPVTDTVQRVASGALEHVPLFQVTNLARVLEMLKTHGVWIVGLADEAAADLYATELGAALALVLGAEGTGLRRLTREHCDLLVSIPMRGVVESLNVSVAAGVCLYEVARRRAR